MTVAAQPHPAAVDVAEETLLLGNLRPLPARAIATDGQCTGDELAEAGHDNAPLGAFVLGRTRRFRTSFATSQTECFRVAAGGRDGNRVAGAARFTDHGESYVGGQKPSRSAFDCSLRGRLRDPPAADHPARSARVAARRATCARDFLIPTAGAIVLALMLTPVANTLERAAPAADARRRGVSVLAAGVGCSPGCWRSPFRRSRSWAEQAPYLTLHARAQARGSSHRRWPSSSRCRTRSSRRRPRRRPVQRPQPPRRSWCARSRMLG